MYGPVTIKRNISKNYEQVAKELFAKIKMLGGCKHPNIVSLVGFAWEGIEIILIFEPCTHYRSLADHLGSFIREKSKLSLKQRIGKCIDIVQGSSVADHLRSISGKTNITWTQRIRKFIDIAHKSSLADHIREKTNLTWTQRIRICIDIAQGLEYLHNNNNMEADVPRKIHQRMLSSNVVLDEKWNAKIATFRLFEHEHSNVYFPDTEKTHIYSFGVILFEILCGRLAHDPMYTQENPLGLVPIARRWFEEGTLKNMLDPNIMNEVRECSYTNGPDRHSLDAYGNIAYQCLSESEILRPTLEHIIHSLNRALTFQEETLEHLKIPLSVIKAATNDFTETYIGEGGYGKVYRAELDVFYETHCRKRTVAIKRIQGKENELRNRGFLAELEIISRCEHPNIISLVGFCFEDSENILVSEYAANGSLDDYLEKGKLSKLPWALRLRMCLDIGYGLSYLHTPDGDKKCILHRDIKSGNILLGENLEVKIADFGLSIFHPKNHPSSTINTEHCAGTHVYLDPEYQEGKLKIASDIYSFGVVLFEIMSGKLAYDRIYTKENGNGIAPVVRQRFIQRNLKEMVDITIMEETHELSSAIKLGPSQDSMDEFFKVACKCVAEAQADRPKMEEVVNGLKRAIDLQKYRKDTLEISLENIQLGGKDFSGTNFDIENTYAMYNGGVRYDNETRPVIIKRMTKCGQEPAAGSWREFEIPFKHKHENVIGLLGYCKKMNENFIVYENMSNKSLDMHMGNAKLTWIKRLKIGIDITNGLKFLHGSDERQDVVIHRDLKSSNILLTEDWRAKVCGFDASITYPNNHNIDYAEDGIGGSPGYCDPLFLKTRIITEESDIYSLGVILFELFCGKLAYTDRGHFLDSFVKDHYDEERPDKLAFNRIREQIEWESLVKYTNIAFQCLHDDRKERPTAAMVLVQVKQALELQEAQDIWDVKLPRNYNEILKLSKTPQLFSTMERKDIYSILSEGILLEEGKMWYSIGGNGERNEMISARGFLYKNRWLRRWRSIKESRFEKVAEISDVSNLNIQIKKSSQLLPPGIDYMAYSVHLVFKFCSPRKSHAKRMYVNLKYKMGNEKLNAYFATWREDGWMMIELCRFSSNKEEINIEVLLESFSKCYCDGRAIYIEGVEFQAREDVKQEKIKQVAGLKPEISKCRFSVNKMKMKKDQVVWYRLSKTKRKEHHTASSEAVLYNSSNVKLSNSKFSAQFRSKGTINLPGQQVFCIKWKIICSMVLPRTEKVCYLVFKLSENCGGLYCPVIVRDESHLKNKDTGILYFRTPSPWNLHDTYWVPKKRRDGWMEVIVWKYNSDYELTNDCLFVNLKLVCYEGTMFGLIVRGLEIRPSSSSS